LIQQKITVNGKNGENHLENRNFVSFVKDNLTCFGALTQKDGSMNNRSEKLER
jgi:hypothetical protein